VPYATRPSRGADTCTATQHPHLPLALLCLTGLVENTPTHTLRNTRHFHTAHTSSLPHQPAGHDAAVQTLRHLTSIAKPLIPVPDDVVTLRGAGWTVLPPRVPLLPPAAHHAATPYWVCEHTRTPARGIACGSPTFLTPCADQTSSVKSPFLYLTTTAATAASISSAALAVIAGAGLCDAPFRTQAARKRFIARCDECLRTTSRSTCAATFRWRREHLDQSGGRGWFAPTYSHDWRCDTTPGRARRTSGTPAHVKRAARISNVPLAHALRLRGCARQRKRLFAYSRTFSVNDVWFLASRFGGQPPPPTVPRVLACSPLLTHI